MYYINEAVKNRIVELGRDTNNTHKRIGEILQQEFPSDLLPCPSTISRICLNYSGRRHDKKRKATRKQYDSHVTIAIPKSVIKSAMLMSEGAVITERQVDNIRVRLTIANDYCCQEFADYSKRSNLHKAAVSRGDFRLCPFCGKNLK